MFLIGFLPDFKSLIFVVGLTNKSCLFSVLCKMTGRKAPVIREATNPHHLILQIKNQIKSSLQLSAQIGWTIPCFPMNSWIFDVCSILVLSSAPPTYTFVETHNLHFVPPFSHKFICFLKKSFLHKLRNKGVHSQIILNRSVALKFWSDWNRKNSHQCRRGMLFYLCSCLQIRIFVWLCSILQIASVLAVFF